MRQIVLDTETTGLSVEMGHRIIEIGAVEIYNRTLTQRFFHCYLNPERLVDEQATRVHGLTYEKLKDKPLFAAVAEEFLEFIADSELIIHNAPFDMSFLNHELKRLNHPVLTDRHSVLDTLLLARRQHPGKKNSLDALCKRYNVQNAHRQWHGALLDAKLLAQVYLQMTGGQMSLDLMQQVTQELAENHHSMTRLAPLCPFLVLPEEESVHQSYLKKIFEKSAKLLWPSANSTA